ncbi:hypothetical protein AAFN60_21570 [Roseibacillus persicicus]|uniref:hypothetical protein n=1 Tax=Roseibacillus persicicus TaxID=454148 RepID=UPI00398B3467
MKTIPSLLVGWLTASTSLFAQAPWSGDLMQKGIAAVTCGAPAQDPTGTPISAGNAFTFGLFDVRNPSPSDYGPCQNVFPPTPVTTPIWYAADYHDPTWNARDLGNVFGIAIDDNGQMYTGAHGLYGTYQPLHHRYGNIGGGAASLSAAGTVYRIDKTTGLPTVYCVIPNQQPMTLSTPTFVSGPGLGNLTFDADHNQFFVTSLEDGKIYRVAAGGMTGTVLNSHDPLAPDSGNPGMPSRDDRLWAVEYHEGEVYYSVWHDGSPGNPSEIRKVGLDGSGNFVPSLDVHVAYVPGQAGWAASSPVVDLTFSLDGQTMVAGVRTMATDTRAYNHASGTHLLELVSGSWTPTHFQRTGCNNPDGEGYGGVALGMEGGTQDAVVWTSSADMVANYGPHGLFGVRLSDVPVNGMAVNSWKVPYIAGFANMPMDDRKGSGGDIEILREEACAQIEVREIHCPEEAGAPYTVDLIIDHNLTSTTVNYLQFKPCPTSSLPAGSSTVQPGPAGIVTLSPLLPANTPYPISVTLPASPMGGMVYFKVKLLNETGVECCLETVCVDLPPCDCAEILDTRIDCEPDPATGLNKYTLTFTVQNQTHLSGSPFTFSGATFLPPSGFDQSSIVLSPANIAPGTTGTVSICYYGVPGALCFNLAVHDGTEENCCALTDICLDLPPCDGHTDPEPDTCALARRIPCCPETGTAVVDFTVCNNSAVPRTYSWSFTSTPTVSCPIMLDPSDLSPAAGFIGPVPAFGCMTVSIVVRCDKFQEPGSCANLELCADPGMGLPVVCCSTVIYLPSPDEPVVKLSDPTGDGPIGLTPGEKRELTFKVQNPTDSELPVSLQFFSENGMLAVGEERFEAVLAPQSSQEVVVPITRRDNGDQSRQWTELQVIGKVLHRPLAYLPVQLLDGDRSKALPKVKKIDTIPLPSATVQLDIQTLPGRYYRVEESSDMLGEWSTTECTVTDGGYANGVFLGNGGVVNCSVPCDELEKKMFYRVVRID